MATKKEKEQLIEVLKFTPRTYKISLWGYGGEKVMGRVDKAVWDYCLENQVDLSDIAWNYDICEEIDLDVDMLPFPPGSWYECDNLAHVSGVSRNAGTLHIEDEEGNTVIESPLDDFDGCSDDSPELSCGDEAWVGMCKKGEVVFIGSSNEKGTFFEGDIELKAPFDITKLTLCYDEVDGEEIICTVMYDGEDIDNYGGSTDGKSSDFNMVLLTNDSGEFERYEPGEKDWGHPEWGPSPDDWEKSPKFKFKQHKPVHVGYYSCNYGYGSTYSSLYWDGENFGEWEYGKFNPINQEGMVTWQGYNWDTSSWVNQPLEPPGIICNNKKCGWVGMSDDRRTDENYEDHCPECDGTDFDWIEYDPETKKGLKNRAKYCVPAMPTASEEDLVQALEELKAEFEELDDSMNPWKKSNTEVKEKISKWWTIKTYYKKSCEQHEYYVQNDGPGRIKVTDGFRFVEYNVETNDGEFPNIEFTTVPGGNGACDSIDLNSCFGSNVESTELVEMFDGGCWGDWEITGIDDEDEVERINEFLEENGAYSLEDEGEWYLDETEVWAWGPFEISDDQGNTRIVIADADGNMIDFKEE